MARLPWESHKTIFHKEFWEVHQRTDERGPGYFFSNYFFILFQKSCKRNDLEFYNQNIRVYLTWLIFIKAIAGIRPGGGEKGCLLETDQGLNLAPTLDPQPDLGQFLRESCWLVICKSGWEWLSWDMSGNLNAVLCVKRLVQRLVHTRCWGKLPLFWIAHTDPSSALFFQRCHPAAS